MQPSASLQTIADTTFLPATRTEYHRHSPAHKNRNSQVAVMRVRSKLVDVEFRFGSIERIDNELVVNSHPGQPLKSRIYISPDDVLTALGKLLTSRGAWIFLLGFPYFYLRSRRRDQRDRR